MSEPGAEPPRNQPDTGSATAAPDTAKKSPWLKHTLAAVAVVGATAVGISQYSGDEPAEPVEPATPQSSGPAQPKTTEPPATTETPRGAHIYRYRITENTGIHAPAAGDEPNIFLKKDSCVESVLGPDNGLSRSGDKIEIMAMATDGVDQVRGFVDSEHLLNAGTRAHSRGKSCVGDFSVSADQSRPASITDNGTTGQLWRPQHNADLFISPTIPTRFGSVGGGSCVTSTGRASGERAEVTVAFGGNTTTAWIDPKQFSKDAAPTNTCQAKFTP